MKLHITLTLDSREAETLLDTLRIGAANRYAATLQRESAEITKLVERRVDAARAARGRKERGLA